MHVQWCTCLMSHALMVAKALISQLGVLLWSSSMMNMIILIYLFSICLVSCLSFLHLLSQNSEHILHCVNQLYIWPCQYIGESENGCGKFLFFDN
jgi:hypothetical protein